MNVAYVGMLLFLALLSIPFLLGKGAFLIAGYNTMTPEEKEKVDAPALCRFVGKLLLCLASAVLLWLLRDLLSQGWLMTMGICLFVAAVVFALVYANTGRRFEKRRGD